MTTIILETRRDAYAAKDAAKRSLTVGELKQLLEDFDDDDTIITSHDNGYTYGSITMNDLREASTDEEEEDDEN